MNYTNENELHEWYSEWAEMPGQAIFNRFLHFARMIQDAVLGNIPFK